MKRLIAVLIGSLLCMIVFPQSKHTFSLGRGTANTFNGMVTPYNLSGTKIIGMTYGNEKLPGKEWKTFFDVDLDVSWLRPDYDFANKLKKEQPFVLELDVHINKSFLKKVLEINGFTAHAGFITSVQGFYQIFDYSAMPAILKAADFFQIGISEGISASMQLKFKKVIFQNTASYLMAGAVLYPNYTSDSPFYNGGSGDYLTFATINKRNYIENRFKAEFPLYIKGKFVNSFSISHDFKYEYSTIKDNVFRRLGHSINIGILFKIDKLNMDVLQQ
jgi:hypothetical protein